jgi:murein peptide amidase A
MRLFFSPWLLASLLSVAAPIFAAPPCDELVARLPNVSRVLCNAAGLQPSAARSVTGRTLWTRDIRGDSSTPAASLNRPMLNRPMLRVLVIGGIHGDELSSSAVALHWLRLADQSPVDMPQTVHWRFIPALNPDGLFSQPPRRVNAHGVDLNRNFPTPNWERDAKIYWEKRTKKDPRRFPGNKPLSEPESRFLFEQMQSFKPQLIVSIHAPYGVLDFDGPVKGGYVPPSKLGRLYLDQVGIFPGSLGNYGGVHQGIPVVTVELPNSTRTPLDAEMRQMWLDLLRWTGEHVGQRAVGESGATNR